MESWDFGIWGKSLRIIYFLPNSSTSPFYHFYYSFISTLSRFIYSCIYFMLLEKWGTPLEVSNHFIGFWSCISLRLVLDFTGFISDNQWQRWASPLACGLQIFPSHEFFTRRKCVCWWFDFTISRPIFGHFFFLLEFYPIKIPKKNHFCNTIVIFIRE